MIYRFNFLLDVSSQRNNSFLLQLNYKNSMIAIASTRRGINCKYITFSSIFIREPWVLEETSYFRTTI